MSLDDAKAVLWMMAASPDVERLFDAFVERWPDHTLSAMSIWKKKFGVRWPREAQIVKSKDLSFGE